MTEFVVFVLGIGLGSFLTKRKLLENAQSDATIDGKFKVITAEEYWGILDIGIRARSINKCPLSVRPENPTTTSRRN